VGQSWNLDDHITGDDKALSLRKELRQCHVQECTWASGAERPLSGSDAAREGDIVSLAVQSAAPVLLGDESPGQNLVIRAQDDTPGQNTASNTYH